MRPYEAALLIECPFCHARPGERCRTQRPTVYRRGRPYSEYIHEPRERPFQEIWAEGFAAGKRAERRFQRVVQRKELARSGR